MNESKWTWRSVSLISITTTVILLVGFVYAVNDIMYPKGEALLATLPKESAVPTAEVSSELKIVAIGDSLAKGTGDNSGSGFVKRTVDGLKAKGEKAELLGNMAINGLTTAGLQNKLKEEGVQYVLRQANVILLSIGGNDLFRGSDILGNGGGIQGTAAESQTSDGRTSETNASGSGDAGAKASSSVNTASPAIPEEITPESLLAGLPEASERLGAILESLTEINPQAQIYYLGLYNPFGDIEDLLVPGNQAVTTWNNAVMDLINTHSQMTLVPTFDLFNRHLDKYLSSDHFHPNGEGYQRVSERIIQAVR